MATVESVKAKLQSLIASCQAVTGSTATDLTSQVAALVGGTVGVEQSLPLEQKVQNLITACQAKTGDGSADLTVQVKALINAVAEATMYLYGKEAEKTVSYNGVQLPDINEVWTDKEKYPYAYIVLYDGTRYFLKFVNTVQTVNGTGTLLFSIGTYYELTSNTWTKKSLASAGGVLVWSNVDCFYGSGSAIAEELQGTLYLKGSEPVYSYENADVTIDGVGYVGAVLPALPEYDKETYPYATISYSSNPVLKGYTLKVYDDSHYYESDSGGWYFGSDSRTNGTGVKVNCLSFKFDSNNNVWKSPTATDGGNTSLTGSTYNTLVWTNFDAIASDGSVFFIATDPVPV